MENKKDKQAEKDVYQKPHYEKFEQLEKAGLGFGLSEPEMH